MFPLARNCSILAWTKRSHFPRWRCWTTNTSFAQLISAAEIQSRPSSRQAVKDRKRNLATEGMHAPDGHGAGFLSDRVLGLPLHVCLPRFHQPRVERSVHVCEFDQVFSDGLRFAHPTPSEPSIHFVS